MSSSTAVVAARTALDEFGTKGEFKRTEAVWRNWIGDGAFWFCLVSPLALFRVVALLRVLNVVPCFGRPIHPSCLS
jgi:hypothetical protein